MVACREDSRIFPTGKETNMTELTFDKVWIMFQEIAEQSKETDKKFKEIAEESIKTEKMFKEMAEQSKRTDKKLNKLESVFNTQWGKLMESLVEGDLIPLLKAKGVKVDQTTQRTKKMFNNQPFEIDIIAKNGDELVFVEVKTTLHPADVEHFLGKLNVIQEVFPECKGKKIYGAMAYLRQESEAAMYAMKQGLYVIRATGSSATIINTNDFPIKTF
jgi:Holliday junction resolvase-like predicted endonuclease